MGHFGSKYIGEEHSKYSLGVLWQYYTMEVDLERGVYCGISLDWNYVDKYVDISMPKYVQKQLDRYGWHKPTRPHYFPYELIHEKESPLLDKEQQWFIQQVIRSFLYYARAVDMTILRALNTRTDETNGANHEKFWKECTNFSIIWHLTQKAVIRFRASEMIPNVHSDASYLSAE